MFRTVAATALIAVLSLSAAQAGSVTVTLKDIDLANPANSQVLAARIQLAAEQACGPADTTDNRTGAVVEARDRHQDCIRHAAHTALASIKAQPRLARTAAVVKLASN